jgi:DNA replication and repair protein RecF
VYLRDISLVNFKNYEEANLVFSPQINCFTGLNGSGKTNLLDAVHYLCACKSYFNPIDSQNIRHDAPFLVVQGRFLKDGLDNEVYCGVKPGQRKVFRRNQKDYDRLADHIGLFPAVVISPYDADLISEGSEERRKFLDSIISQFNRSYLDDLIRYNKALMQRNRLLRAFALNRYFDEEALVIWDELLIDTGQRIHQARVEFLHDFNPRLLALYADISGNQDQIGILYRSELENKDFRSLLLDSRERDRYLQRTDVGIHRDDLIFSIDGHPLKKFGSQGQQKSYLIALKLAQFDHIRDLTGTKPILLLDDIFDKIDDRRVAYLMELVSRHNFGQIFISDTHDDRIPLLFKSVNAELLTFKVEKGRVIPLIEVENQVNEGE